MLIDPLLAFAATLLLWGMVILQVLRAPGPRSGRPMPQKSRATYRGDARSRAQGQRR